MSDITINGQTFQCDFMDADFMVTFEAATKEMYEKANANRTKKFSSVAEGMYATCDVCNEYLDKVFGEGSAERIFNGSHNVQEHLEAVAALTDAHQKSKKEFNDFSNRYIQRQYQKGKR